MSRIDQVRALMRSVRKTELAGEPKTMNIISQLAGVPQSQAAKLMTVTYAECFAVEQNIAVRLTGKWPEDIAFDWETLKPLENADIDKRFRAPKTTSALKDAFAQPPKEERNWAETQYSLDLIDKVLENGAKVTVETLINFFAIEETYKPVLDGLRALVELLELKGPEKKPDFFHEITGLHYAYPREVAK